MKSWLVFGCLVMMVSGVAMAGKDKPPAPQPPAEAEGTERTEGTEGTEGTRQDSLAKLPNIVGPQQIDLGHQAQLDLPEGMVLFERAAAQEIMRRGGNDTEGVVAAIVPTSETSHWLVVIEAADVGYVSDRDASDLDASEMLDQFKKGTIEQNKKRRSMGVPELFLDGWSEPPRYEPTAHHLVWGLNGHDTDGKVVNFFTRFLGRNGYLSIDLIDDPSTIEASKAQALSILTALHFNPGARYEDHVGSDKDSGLGLKALVLGGAGVVIAKKTGILVAILLALKKVFVVVIAAIGGFFRWLFRRKKQEPDDSLAVSDPLPPPPSDPGTPPAA